MSEIIMRMGTDGNSIPPTQSPMLNGAESLPNNSTLENNKEVENHIVNSNDNFDSKTLTFILQLLKKNGKYHEAVESIEKECKISKQTPISASQQPSTNDENNALSAYTSEGDPETYEDIYQNLLNFVEKSMDAHKHELSMTIYPVFVHMYLELVYNSHENQAVKFMTKYGSKQEHYYQEDIQVLSTIIKKEHMMSNMFQDNFKSGQFIVRMSRDTYKHFKQHLQLKQNKALHSIVQEHLYIDVHEGLSRQKDQVDSTSGSLVGEATRQANKAKIYHGLLKEPELNVPLEDDEDAQDDADKPPKKKKLKKDLMVNKKARTDPNAPPQSRIPLPELKEVDKNDKIAALKEATKRVKLGPETLPSICFYTILNSSHSVTSIQISEDSTLISVGFADSLIKVWSLTTNKLKCIKSASELDLIDKDADDVLYRMMDERSATDMKTLFGHTGPVYCTSFSPDKSLLVSCSEDATVRLWSLHTWTNIVCYKGHCFPVWNVKFSPHGHYFVSSGHDRTARVWAIDNAHPVRIFAGHSSDVDCCIFHPNSNYVATGSSDRTIRLWDMVNGNCVRFMTGHKAQIMVLSFSPCGRFLASAGLDKRILMWDVAFGHLLAEFSGHTNSIHTLAFSREGAILASGSLDNTVKIWNVGKLVEELDPEDLNIAHAPPVRINPDNVLLGSYPTKSSPPIALHFTQRNLLLSAGMFEP